MYELLLVPIYHEVNDNDGHWALVAIYPKDKVLIYFDSLKWKFSDGTMAKRVK